MKRTLILAAALLMAAGCSKHTVRERGNTVLPDDGKKTETILEKKADWSISYKGREDYTEENGRVVRVEHVAVVCPDAGYYMIRSLTPDELKDLFDNDLKSFFETEAQYVREDAAAYGDKVTDYLYIEEMSDYLFDRMRMGNYLMFIIGMNEKGYITGAYAETTFTLSEETPDGDYLKWIGEWTLSGGGISYPVSVEQGEANFTYIFRGWETGESIDTQTGTVMDQEYLETAWDYDNGNMYFTSQYLGTYTENNRDLDELFLGKVNITTAADKNDNGIWLITDEGLDLGCAQMSGEGSSAATVSGCGVYVPIGSQEILTDFISMQYIAAYMKTQTEVAYDEYNLNVPVFPLTMTRTRSAVSRPAWQPRPVTRASLHRGQPRLHSDAPRARGAIRSAR